jgi:hypothetical protein
VPQCYVIRTLLSCYSFYICFLVLYIFLSILCVVFVLFCVLFLLIYTVVSFLFVYQYHSQRVENQLQLINVTTYHIKQNMDNALQRSKTQTYCFSFQL